MTYNKLFDELKRVSKVNGLSETGISAIGWSEENKTLVIGYRSSNIDLIIKNSVFNLPEILNKYLPVEKKINKIITYGRYAYLATSFGIVIVDLVRNEIHDTWKPGPDSDFNEVFDIAIDANTIYAATERGTWYADPSAQGLPFFGNWRKVAGLPEQESRCTLIIKRGDKLYINISPSSITGDSVFEVGENTRLISNVQGLINRSFDPAPEGFTVSSTGPLRYFYDKGTINDILRGYEWGDPDISQAVIDNGNIWIADLNYGLVRGENLSDYNILSPPGPASNFVSNILNYNGKTIICGGGTDDFAVGKDRKFLVSVFENYVFTNIIKNEFRDAMRSCVDPSDPDHYFISSWGDGLFEFKNNVVVKHYDESNTPQLASDGGSGGTKICGLTMDKIGNLWITQTGSSGSIKILKSDGSWINYTNTGDIPAMSDILLTQHGQFWIILPGTQGILVIDDNKTPLDFSDDRNKVQIIKDDDGNIIPEVFSVAEDLDGNIWVGTGRGPLIYYNPDAIFDTDARAARIKIPRKDGSGLADYLLENEIITSIMADGANRKWLGTVSSGAYLISSDGNSVLKNYSSKNSPLFSDSIASISVDNKTGEIWFGTSAGILSVRETATRGADNFTNVYAFPNPVREDFSGNVTITGLMKDSRIKITDVSGNLVYDTVSEGGQAQWDLTTYNGERVTTGVYLVFCSGNPGSKGYVAKILVIGR
jgi:hypothetical protein